VNRKGSLKSLGAIFVVTLGILFSSVIATILLKQMTGFAVFSTGLPGQILQQGINMMGVVDDIFLFVVGTLMSIVVIQSFRTSMHPIFGAVGLFGLAGIVVVSGMIANIASFFVNLNVVSPAANTFGNMIAFFQNLPTITAVFGAFTLLVMVAGGRLLTGGAR